MIENPELTLKILRHFARDDVPFPSNLADEDLYQVFPKEKPENIKYSLYCAIKTGLLKGSVIDTSTFDGDDYMISRIFGLSPKGGDYVRNAERHFEKALDLIRKKGEAVTTSLLVQVVNQLVINVFK